MIWKLCAWIVLTHLWQSCDGAAWVGKEPGPILTCSGKNATFIWNFTGNFNTISQISWTFEVSAVKILLFGSLGTIPGKNYTGRVRYEKTLGNGALVLSNVSSNDNGIYSISLAADGNNYESQMANLTVTDVSTCFANIILSVNGVQFKSSEAIPVEADSVTIDVKMPEGCNYEASCVYGGESCGESCRLKTFCSFTVNKKQGEDDINVLVTPCQGDEYKYTITLTGSTTSGLSAGAVAGIVIGVFCVCVIVIIVVIFLMKAKTR